MSAPSRSASTPRSRDRATSSRRRDDLLPRSALSDVASGFTQTRLWREARGIPRTLERTLAEARGFDEVAALVAAEDVRRVIATGNGAALYVAHALWLASLEGRTPFEIVAVPAGVLASSRFAWREGD